MGAFSDPQHTHPGISHWSRPPGHILPTPLCDANIHLTMYNYNPPAIICSRVGADNTIYFALGIFQIIVLSFKI